MIAKLRVPLLASLVVLGGALLACSSGDSSPAVTTAAGGAATVDATLTDFAIALSASGAPAGSVTFAAKNDGVTPHELVIIKSDLAPDALPVSGATVSEDAVDYIGEIEEFPAGESQKATFDPRRASTS